MRIIPGLTLIGIDSASLVFAGNENDRGEVASFMMALNGMADRLKAGILLLAHTSKTQNDNAANMASGSTSWVWQARSALRLKLRSDGAPELSHPKANHARKIEPILMRWSEQGVLHRASGGLLDLEQATLVKFRIALASLAEAIANHGEPAPHDLGGPKLIVVRYETWRSHLAETLYVDEERPSPATLRQALKRLIDNLERRRFIKRDGVFVWPVPESER